MQNRKKRPHAYSESFRLEVVSEYYHRNCPEKTSFSLEFGIDRQSLYAWLKQYPLSDNSLSLSPEERLKFMAMEKENIKPDVDPVTARIENLEKALAAVQLKNKAFETMIDIAEEAEGISIRKNTGAKQSAHCTKNRKTKKR